MHLSTKLTSIVLLFVAIPAYGQGIEPETVVARIEALGGAAYMHIENDGGPGPSIRTNRVASVNLSGNLTGDKVGVNDLRLVGSLTSTTHLHLSWTPTTNTGVYHLYWLTNLKHLSLEDTKITDKALEALRNMDQMEQLFLNKNQISSSGLKYLPRMTKLKSLYVGETNVGRLECLAQFPKLEKLNLSGTRVGSNDLRHLANLPKLEWLFLDDTSITNQGLVHLARCRKLTILTLRKTWVTKDAADAFRKVLPNCTIKHSRRSR